MRLVVRAPRLRARQRLIIVGEGKELGDWDASKGIAMTEHNYNEWIVNLDANMFPDEEAEFKFVAVSDDDKSNVIWECGNNRTIKFPALESGEVVVYDLDQAFFPLYNTRVAGTLVPVFSLRSKHSFGVGDFGDLKRFVDYIALTGQHVLQVLPVNDTTSTHTWTDSYPYSCISIFALHPQYADLGALPELKDAALREKFEKERREPQRPAEDRLRAR